MSEYTEKQLLEWAAKAAGEEVEWHHVGSYLYRKSCNWPAEKGFFNPLHDDGESRRIEVALGLHMIIHKDWVEVRREGVMISNACSSYSPKGCMLATARLAVLRAAAEIGRAMP